MLKLILILTVIFLKPRLTQSLLSKDLVVVTLVPDSVYGCCSQYKSDRDHPIVYCYYGTHKTLMNIWQTVSVTVDMVRPGKYEMYEGENEYDVWSQYESSQQSTWRFSIWGQHWRRRNIVLNPFNTTCLGIQTSQDYALKVYMTPVNIMLVGMFTLGTLLFFLSPILVHNQLFYYVAGVAIGVFTSVLVLLYFIISFMPLKRPAMIGMMVGGSTIICYFLQSIVDNIFVLIPMYKKVIYGYVIVTGIISFIVCYRFGPLSNPRSKNIFQWSLQTASLVLVLYSSYNYEVTVILSVVIILIYKLPVTRWMINSIRNIFANSSNRNEILPQDKSVFKAVSSSQCSKRRRRFLTVKEYKDQGKLETTRGLEEIRQYYKTSPNRWKKIKRIELNKFAKFMSGGSHIYTDEIEAKSMEELFTDEDE